MDFSKQYRAKLAVVQMSVLFACIFPAFAQILNEDFTVDPGLVLPVAGNNDLFRVGSDPVDTWVKSAANNGSNAWAWQAGSGDLRMVQATDDARYFVYLVSEGRVSAGSLELQFNVAWNGEARAEVFIYTLDAGLGTGENFDIRGPDIELTVPAAAVLVGHHAPTNSPGLATQVITSINVAANDQIMLIFGVEGARGDAAAFDNIVLTSPFDPDDTDRDGLNDDWERLYFPDLRQDGEGDFDSDFFSNAAEQDLGTLPNDANSKPGINLAMSLDTNQHSQVQFLRFPNIGQAYELQSSTNLSEWLPHLEHVVPLRAIDRGTGYETLHFEALPITQPERMYLRAQVKSAGPIRKPNVVIIYTDDMGYGDAGVLNPNAKFSTPNIDRIANEGINFTDGHCSDTVCTPSRYGLLTGRYCWRTTLKGGVIGAEQSPSMIATGRMTVASLLRDNGYQTGMVGKWHLGMDIPGTKGNRSFDQPIADQPLDHGFDYFYGIPASLNFGYLAWIEGRFTATNPTLWTKKKANNLPGVFNDYRITPPYELTNTNGNTLEVAADFDDILCLTRFTDKAIDWMERQLPGATNGTPFCLYLPLTSSHKPVIPRLDFQGLSRAGAYGDFMMETDYHVGRVLDFLDDPNGDGNFSDSIATNTFVFFSSDNGPESTYTQRVTTYGHDSAGLFRGGKRDVYEGGHRVPFFIRWPEVIAAGRTWDRPVCQTDLIATLAEMLGARLPNNVGEDSDSFFDVLIDAPVIPERLPMVNHASDGQFAIRYRKWKLIMEHGTSLRELYDLEADPAETANLLGNHPELEAKLEAQLTAIVQTGRSNLGGAVSNDSAPWWSDLKWIPQP